MKVGGRYSSGKLLEALSSAQCSLLQQNYYVFDCYNDILKDIGDAVDIDFAKRIRTLGEIKKVLADTKK